MSKDTRRARWLSVKLGRKEIPWAYLKIEPFRSIATLELVGVLLAVMLFSKGAGWEQSRGVAGLPGLTDNQAITHVRRKFGTASFPLTVVVMELADELFEAFTEKNRIHVDFDNLPFIILWEMELAGELDEEVKLARSSKEAKGDRPESTKKAKKKGEMKWKEPW